MLVKFIVLTLTLVQLSFTAFTNAASPPLLRDVSPIFSHIFTQREYRVSYLFLTPEQLVTLNDAIVYWNRAVGKNFIKLDSENPNILFTTVPLVDGLLGIAMPFENQQCAIAVDPSASTNVTVVMHELGHCFGLAHVEPTPDNCGKLMYPHAGCLEDIKGIDKDTKVYMRDHVGEIRVTKR